MPIFEKKECSLIIYTPKPGTWLYVKNGLYDTFSGKISLPNEPNFKVKPEDIVLVLYPSTYFERKQLYLSQTGRDGGNDLESNRSWDSKLSRYTRRFPFETVSLTAESLKIINDGQNLQPNQN